MDAFRWGARTLLQQAVRPTNSGTAPAVPRGAALAGTGRTGGRPSGRTPISSAARGRERPRAARGGTVIGIA